MDRQDAPANDVEGSLTRVELATHNQNPWNRPLGSLLLSALDNGAAIRRFLSLTGGSILYCLSALSIVYGIPQIIGPPLAKSGALGDILPCVAVLNVYELALLAVLVLIVVWQNVTDDALSLVVLAALFLVASGMTLGVVAPSGLDICLAIGLASVVLGLLKLYVLRRYVSLPIGGLTALGLAVLLLWNFAGPSLMARPLMARTATDEVRRSQWLFGWLVLLAGAILVLVQATRRNYDQPAERGPRTPFLRTQSMVWMFTLVILAALGVHQYAIAYMFAVDYTLGDFVPLVAIVSLLLLEFTRSLRRPTGQFEIVIACVPLGMALLAVQSKLTSASVSTALNLVSSPPVVLGVTGLAILWLGICHQRRWLRHVAIAYALGILLTVGRIGELNWELGGGGLILVLLILGAVQRNVSLCSAGVILLAIGLGQADVFARFAKLHHLTTAGAAAGVAGLGTLAIAIAFGRKVPRILVFVGSLATVVCILDFLPKSLHWLDLAVIVIIGVLFTALLLRTGDIAPALVLWIPVLPRGYLFATNMSSWNFVVLSFALLFLGALVSLFLKRKLAPVDSSPSPSGEKDDGPLSSAT